jgi:eukaryotic-like serine/threonine-protein kinase
VKDETYRQAAEIFQEAVEREGENRRTYLDRACGDDGSLRDYVEKLLEEDAADEDAFSESRLRAEHELLADALGVTGTGQEGNRSAPPPPLPCPETIGRYRIIEKIGEGGMGAVYLAEQDHPRRRVALKMIRTDLLSPSMRKRFEFEAEVLGMLQHPGIAQIHEAGEIEGGLGPTPYLAMEYIEGIELRRYTREQDLGIRERLELVARIADAVHHAHQKGILHRDLKPDNVLVMDNPAPTIGGAPVEFSTLGQPKILDFGVARATNADLQLSTMHTAPGQLVGTLPYMSPEQVAGDAQRLDTRSDIYALGVILYELLAGEPPFDLKRKPIPEAARIIREKEPTRLGSVDVAFRGDIDTIAGKALEKEVSRRYQSAADLASDLRRYLAHEPIDAHPPSTFYQLRKFAQRHKVLVGGLATILLVLIAGILSTTFYAVSARKSEKRARENEDRALQGEAAAERNAQRLHLSVAQALLETDTPRALAHLKAVPPDLRGWEWHHLKARFDSHITEYRGGTRYSFLRNMARSAEGGFLAAIERDGAIELVDLEQGEILCSYGADEELWCPLLSPDGSLLASFPPGAGKIRIWKTGDPAPFLELEPDRGPHCFAYFSPRGEWLLVQFTEKSPIVIDTRSGRWNPVPELRPGHNYPAFTSDGRNLLAKVYEGRVTFYAVEDKKHHTRQLRCSEDFTLSLFSPDDQLLALSYDNPRVIRILDSRTFEESRLLTGRLAALVGAAFSPDGRYLASSASDGTVRVWDVLSGETVRVFSMNPEVGCARTVAFSGDGELLAAANTQGARIWRWKEVDCRILAGSDLYIYRVAFDPAGSLIASGSFCGPVRLWDALTGEQLAVLSGGGAGSSGLGFTPDGSRLMMSGGKSRNDLRLAVWDPHALCQVKEPRSAGDADLLEDVEPVNALSAIRYFGAVEGGSKAVEPVGESIASSRDRTLLALRFDAVSIELLDLRTGKSIRRFGKHDHEINALAISPDTRSVVSGDAGGVIKVWDAATGSEIGLLEGHSRQLYTIAFSPDGTRIASSGEDADIILWDARTFEQLLVLRGHTSYVHTLVFSPDGTQLVSGSGDGTVRIWDSVLPAERWKQIKEAKRLRREAEPLVERLRGELGDPLDVADRLRGDASLSEDLRRAALMVLLKRSSKTNETRK